MKRNILLLQRKFVYCISLLLVVFFLGIISCSKLVPKDVYRETVKATKIAAFFDNQKLGFEKVDLEKEDYDIPIYVEETENFKRLLFFYEIKEATVYPKELKEELLKEKNKFDYQVFIQLKEAIGKESYGYTNEKLTNVTVYYYQVTKKPLLITDNGEVTIKKINEKVWDLNAKFKIYEEKNFEFKDNFVKVSVGKNGILFKD